MSYSQAQLETLAIQARYWSLVATTQAGSGHPSSALSAADIGVGVFFGGLFHYDLNNPANPSNDRFILSKGHASPLLYALWLLAGAITPDEIRAMRSFDSVLEGHPSRRFAYTEAATGSLGQGLSIGVGMALNQLKFDQLSSRVYVLMGDSEMSEGSVWEAMQSAAYYQLNNLIGIIDVNRLGQRGETMPGYNLDDYVKKCQAFGWNTILIDGHHLGEIMAALQQVQQADKPSMIIAKTVKGKGVSWLENQDNWHGKAPNQEQFALAIQELGSVDENMRAQITDPIPESKAVYSGPQIQENSYPVWQIGESISSRQAYGQALNIITRLYSDIVVLDAEVSNSTYAQHADANRFVEMFIAEQNMIGVATGLSLMGKKPFASSFAGFLTRAYDQIRMAQYNSSNLVLVGSHCGVSIGADGFSQMALQDISFMRGLFGAIIVYPSDAYATLKLTEQVYLHPGLSYLRLTRAEVPVLYSPEEIFVIGGSKTLHSSEVDEYTLIGAGITLYECLKAYAILKERGIRVRVIDLYSIQPLDTATLHQAARETKALIVVEDHHQAGGIAEAVRSELSDVRIAIHSLAVFQTPRSGTPSQLLDFEQIDQQAIIQLIDTLIQAI